MSFERFSLKTTNIFSSSLYIYIFLFVVLIVVCLFSFVPCFAGFFFFNFSCFFCSSSTSVVILGSKRGKGFVPCK